MASFLELGAHRAIFFFVDAPRLRFVGICEGGELFVDGARGETNVDITNDGSTALHGSLTVYFQGFYPN